MIDSDEGEVNLITKVKDNLTRVFKYHSEFDPSDVDEIFKKFSKLKVNSFFVEDVTERNAGSSQIYPIDFIDTLNSLNEYI